MKCLFLILFCLPVAVVLSQKHNQSVVKKNVTHFVLPISPDVILKNTSYTIDVNEDSLGKTIMANVPLYFTIKSDKPQPVQVETKILTATGNGIEITALGDGKIYISASQYESSTISESSLRWTAFGILNLSIKMDKKAKDESIFIIKSNDVNTVCNIKIHIKNKNETAAESAATSSVKEQAKENSNDNSGTSSEKNKKTAPPQGNSPVASDTNTKPVFQIVETKQTTLQAYYSKDKNGEAQDTVQVVVQRSGCESLPNEHEDTLFFKFDDLSFPKGSLIILDPTQIVKTKAWDKITATTKGTKEDTTKCFTTVILHLKKTRVDTMKNDEIGSIGLDSGEGKHFVRLSGSGVYTTQPFWLELGTNFDLLDKITTNNLYGGVFMFKKDVAPVSKQHAFSFSGGFYESKSTSSLNSSDSGLIYRDNTSFFADSNNNYPYYRDTGTFNTTASVRSIGLFFSPLYRLDKTSVDVNNFHWFLSFYAEMLWQRVNVSYDYNNLHRAQTMYAPNKDTLYNVRYKEYEKEYDYRSHYFGIGLPIYIKEDNFNFYLNTVLGISTQKFVLISSLDTTNTKTKFPFAQSKKNLVTMQNSFAQPKHTWNPFYLFQFRLNEETFGASITGEIRGFLMRNTKPVVSISVSKKFNLPALLKNIVAPFGVGG